MAVKEKEGQILSGADACLFILCLSPLSLFRGVIVLSLSSTDCLKTPVRADGEAPPLAFEILFNLCMCGIFPLKFERFEY